MGWVLLVIGILFIIATVVKTNPKNETEAANIERMERHKSKMRVFGGAACLIGVLVIAFGGTPSKPDKELYLTFYKEAMQRATELDGLYGPFNRALTRNDLIDAVSVATSIKERAEIMWSKLHGMDAPSLQDKEAEKTMKEGHEYLSSAYFAKNEALEAVIEYAKQPSAFTIANIKNKTNKIQGLTLMGVASFVTAGSKLGLKDGELTVVGQAEDASPK